LLSVANQLSNVGFPGMTGGGALGIWVEARSPQSLGLGSAGCPVPYRQPHPAGPVRVPDDLLQRWRALRWLRQYRGFSGSIEHFLGI
jgi:hypothetical protein